MDATKDNVDVQFQCFGGDNIEGYIITSDIDESPTYRFTSAEQWVFANTYDTYISANQVMDNPFVIEVTVDN